MIIQRRKELGITLKELGKKCGVSDALLNHYEVGRRYPSPTNLLKIMAELEFGPDEFVIVLDQAPESWMARRMASLPSDELCRILRGGRKAAKLDLDKASVLANVGKELLRGFESGSAVPSRALLATIVGSWGLSRSAFQSLLKDQTHRSDFAAELLAALLEQAGFTVSPLAAPGFVHASIGGGWSLNINVTLTRHAEH